MNAGDYRPELPPVPPRMLRLPVRRGYPVPWFVAMVDGDYHFPTADGRKLAIALARRLCWVCGQPLGSYFSFVIGSMCAVNKTTSEPPCHKECAIFSAIACPFLTRPHMKRQKQQPEGSLNPPGMHLDRNPGVALVWITRKYTIIKVPHGMGAQEGILFRLSEPTEALWYAEGRAATREEVMASISSGLPLLQKVAAEDGPDSLRALDREYTAALQLVPA